MTNYLMGVDIGTTNCKVSIFTEDGVQIGQISQSFNLIKREEKIEVNPLDWWEVLVVVIRQCIEKAGIKGHQISSIGVSGTNALVVVDKNSVPLRNAIMQIDNRASLQANHLNGSIKDKVFNITGNRIASGMFLAPTILWIKKNENKIYNNTYKFLVPNGYINYKLTGEFSIDYSRASTSLLFDIKKKCWSQELCDLMDIRIDKLPCLYNSYEIIGKVTYEAAQQTTLRKDTPVIAGCMDTVAAGVGLGIVEDKEAFLILGTMGRVGICLSRPTFDNRFMNLSYVISDLWLSQAVTSGVGASLTWFRDNFYTLEKYFMEQLLIDPNEIFIKEGQKLNAGVGGIIYIPNILGERSPGWNSNKKGIFYGISYENTKADFMKAILEGIGYSFRRNIEALENTGLKILSLRVGGGGAGDKLWRQIIADITGKIILLPSIIETETIGAAILAGKGIGIYKDIKPVIDNFNPIIGKILPNKSNYINYSKQFELYKKLDELSDRRILVKE